jgi:hypothetical protein
MSEYEHADALGDRLIIDDQFPGGRTLTAFETFRGEEHHAAVRLPKDPPELHKLTEAIHGRKIAGILYEHNVETGFVGAGTYASPAREIAAIVYEDELPVVEYDDGSFGAGPAVLPRAHRGNVWNLAIGYAAIARHIEARDAAKGAAERKADEVWDQVKALPVRDAVRRAYELGADSERTEAGA